MKSKKIISAIILAISIQILQGQIPVTDAATSGALTANNALTQQNLAKNAAILGKATATLKTLSNMKKEYDKWSANIEKITKTIEVGKDVINIGNCLDDIKKTYRSSMALVRSSYLLDSKDQKRILFVYTKVLNDCISITSDSIDVITDGTYKMNDAERLTFLKEALAKLQKKMALMRYMNQKIKHAEKRALANKVNNDVLNSDAIKIKG